jgi:tRNA (cytidine/uridine-2'-O-)-methyltransferase
LPPSLLEPNRERLLRIPIRQQARSLNLSNAVGIVTFEALRQLGGA